MKKIWYVLFFSMFLTFPLWGSRYKSHLPANVQKRIAENKNSHAFPNPKEEKNGENDLWVWICGLTVLSVVYTLGSMYLNIDDKYLKRDHFSGDHSGGLE